jgi:hypothetical protein
VDSFDRFAFSVTILLTSVRVKCRKSGTMQCRRSVRIDFGFTDAARSARRWTIAYTIPYHSASTRPVFCGTRVRLPGHVGQLLRSDSASGRPTSHGFGLVSKRYSHKRGSSQQLSTRVARVRGPAGKPLINTASEFEPDEPDRYRTVDT